MAPHLLEDVQEMPSEGVNNVKLTPSRFSLSRLFGIGEGKQSSGQETKNTFSHEDKPVKTTPVSTAPPSVDHEKFFKPIHGHDPTTHDTHESDDDEDHGIYFVAGSSKSAHSNHRDSPHKMWPHENKNLNQGSTNHLVSEKDFETRHRPWYEEEGDHASIDLKLG